MKQPMMLVALVGFSTAFCLADDAGQWSISGGVQVRQISAHFSAPAPGGWAGWQTAYGAGDANGAMALYDGVTPRMQYSDGAIIFDSRFTGFDGSALFGADTVAQLGVNPVNGYETVTFSSHAGRFSSHVSNAEFSTDDEDLGMQPFVQACLGIARWDHGSLSVVAGYGIARASLDSGPIPTTVQTIRQTTARGRFEYDVDPQSGTLPTPPFEGTETTVPGYWIVYDADAYNTTYPFLSAEEPRSSTATSHRTVDRITAFTEASLDLALHEILFGLDWSLRPFSRWELSITAGPTLNILSWDMDTSTSWQSEKTGAELASSTHDDSGTDVAVGAAARLAARILLDADGRFYLEANAGYSWVDSVQAEAGPFKADIDATSFTGSAGVGVRM